MHTRLPQHCKWAEPTLFLPWPAWLDAWAWPWSCRITGETLPVLSAEGCVGCPRWEPKAPSPSEAHASGRARAIERLLRGVRDSTADS